MMKTILRTYKFRLKPNSEQRELLAKHFGCVRFVFNHFLGKRQEEYKSTGKSSNYYKQQAELAQLKKGECEWLKEVNSQTLQVALRNMDTAYQNFFSKKAAFPKFKSKKTKNSFSVPQNCSLDDFKIYIPKFREGISYFKDRKVKGVVKSMTISLTPTGKYFVSILTEQEYEPIEKTDKAVGIDLGLRSFVITSEGIRYPSQRLFKKYQNKLATAQKHLSRKNKGSNNFEKQKVKVAKLYEKVSNTRTDYLHKVSLDLLRKYDIIFCEDLNVKGMMKNHRLARNIGDAAWGEFVRMLEYKAEMNDKHIGKIGRYYPSSKTCHTCGYVNRGLGYEEEWVCPECGAVIDRDWNAALNILSAGLAEYTCGLFENPVWVGRKSEARTPLIH